MMEQELATEVLSDADQKMRTAVSVLGSDLQTMRTSRASPSLVERLPVDYYGSPVPLQQLAGISVPEPRLIAIQPWDRTTHDAIETAIQQSDLGLTPSNDGNIIRIVLPPLTEERRRDLVRAVQRRVEEGRVAIRNVRRQALADLRELQRERLMTEDDLRWSENRLQELTDRSVEQAGLLGEDKVKELLEE